MENLLFSLECVVPLFVLIAAGYLLKQKKIINDDFISAGTRLVFKVSLPAMLFRQVASADFSAAFDMKLLFFTMAATLVIIVLLCLFVPRFIHENKKRGAFIQGVFRGNYAIIGIPMAISIFGEENAVQATLMLPFTVPLYNAAAVIVLTIFSRENTDDPRQKIQLKPILKGILTNPLIIGIVLGIPFSLFSIQLPTLVDKTLQYFTNLTTPLALIALGGQFTFQQAKSYRRLTAWAVILKEVLIPLIVLSLAVKAGFRGSELGVVFITFTAPSAVSSYIMAKNMGSDDILAGQILIFTTIFSCLTMFVGIYVLRTLGYFA